MSNSTSDQKSEKGGRWNGDMMPYSLRLPDGLLIAAKDRAGMIPLARVIRRLIELWVEGKIKLEDYED